MIGLPSLDSFTMGQGSAISPSSSAASATGNQSTGAFYGGNVNTTNPNKPNLVVLGAFALLALIVWKKT